MNTKSYVYAVLISVLYLAVALAVQPLYVQASQTSIDEIEQSFQDEIKPTDKQTDSDLSTPTNQSTPNEQHDSVNNPKPVEEPTDIQTQNPSTDTNETASEESEQPDEQIQEATSETTPQTKTDTTTDSVYKKTEYKPDTHNSLLSKFIDKFKCFTDKLPVNKIVMLKNSVLKYLSDKPFFNKICKFEQTPPQNKVANYDFLPYYFLTPSTEVDYLKKIVFSDKIVNITELMPYCFTLKISTAKILPPKNLVTPQGTDDVWVLVNAPSPQIEVTGKSTYAKLVIDIANNTLYKYDKNGFPLKAYLVATGARGTRTMAGLRIVTYKERFPYSGAPNSKRALDPYSYGPYIIFLNIVDPKTGRQSVVEQLLHGNGNEYSIGRKVSHGCVRTNNNVMKCELSKEVKRGDYILLINPDTD